MATKLSIQQILAALPDMSSPTELASATGMSTDFFKKRRKAGEMPAALKLGSRVRYPKAEVDLWLKTLVDKDGQSVLPSRVRESRV